MTQYDEHLQIETPENVAFGYEVAGLGSRFMAAVVDTTVIGAVMVVISVLILALTQTDITALSFATAVIGFILWVFFWGYYIFFELLWNGQSPGKRVMKLRVIRDNGAPIGLTESLIRNILRTVDLLPGNYGIGAVSMFIDRQSRRLGDLAAGVLVVYEGESVTLDRLNNLETRRRSDAWLARNAAAEESAVRIALPIDRLDESDIQLVETYLNRRFEVADDGRWGRELIRRLSEKMEIPYQTRGDNETILWLQRLADTYRRVGDV